jgi:queuine tRNA-ribosyltransferase catalytic subunit
MASIMMTDDYEAATSLISEGTSPTFTTKSPALCLHVHAQCNQARASTMFLPHGEVKLPIFMPVGTKGTIKGLSSMQLLNNDELAPQIILGNTYHLALQPGTDILHELGGVC